MSIASALPALALQGMSEMCVSQAVTDLLARNEMYSTIDEEHFAVIDLLFGCHGGATVTAEPRTALWRRSSMFRPDWRARRRPEVPDMNVRVLTVYEMRPTSRIASGIAASREEAHA